MKKLLIYVIVVCAIMLIGGIGCATLKQPAGTIGMNSEEKIHYYQQQIDSYNFLIDQEKKKIEAKK